MWSLGIRIPDPALANTEYFLRGDRLERWMDETGLRIADVARELGGVRELAFVELLRGQRAATARQVGRLYEITGLPINELAELRPGRVSEAR